MHGTRYDKDSDGKVNETKFDHTSEPGMETLHREVKATRTLSPEVQSQDSIYLCIAWCTNAELRLFRKFPSLLYCDATGDTNKTRNHLVTFSGRTPDGQQFIFLKVWVHNQKRVTFKWIFQVVLKSFIPKETQKMVHLVLVDGDPQQMNELKIALANYLTNASFANCAFHLVTLGFKKLEYSIRVPAKERRDYDQIVSTLLDWIYSFIIHET